MTYKILASGSATYNGTVSYTAPSGKTTLISKIFLHSTGATPSENFKLEVTNSVTYTTTTLYRGNLGGAGTRETLEITGGIVLPEGSTITLTGDLDNWGAYIDATFFGDEA